MMALGMLMLRSQIQVAAMVMTLMAATARTRRNLRREAGVRSSCSRGVARIRVSNSRASGESAPGTSLSRTGLVRRRAPNAVHSGFTVAAPRRHRQDAFHYVYVLMIQFVCPL